MEIKLTFVCTAVLTNAFSLCIHSHSESLQLVMSMSVSSAWHSSIYVSLGVFTESPAAGLPQIHDHRISNTIGVMACSVVGT